MNEIFVCSRCGRSHTIEEFNSSRFCHDCGRFLSRLNKMGRTTKEHASLERPFFPYKPYPQQLEFMKDIKNVVEKNRILVAEACNGFGKTICTLSSILSMGKKIIYATRTHEQVRQVLIEIEQINKVSKYKFKAVNLASRQHLCLNEKCRKLNAIEALEACRILREMGECSFDTKLGYISHLPPVLSISKLRKEGKKKGICPYYLARKKAEDSTVIVAPYQYVFNKRIRSRVKLDLNGKILIFDEAHNADQIGQEALSGTLSERTLNNAKKELEVINSSSQFVDDFIEYLERKISERVIIQPAVKLRDALKEIIGLENLTSFNDIMSDLVDEIRQNKIERGSYPICYLNGMLNFVNLVASGSWSSYVAIYRRSFYGFNLVEYRCLDPSLAIKPVVEEASGSIIMSGTLSPIGLFTEILGLKEAETRTYSAIADPRNIRTIIDPNVTTRFAKRGEEMIRRIGERISRLITKIPNGVLIFFPGRKFMLDALNNWKKTGIIRGNKEQLFLKNKGVYVEGSKAVENRKIVTEYKITAKTEKGAVLFGVFRGRNAEGSNFPYDEARGIFLVGVPYADYSDPLIKVQIDYYNKKAYGLGEKWYTMDAFKAANQAMGRGIRHRDDWCNFILMDKRYQTHQTLISKWALINGFKELPS